VEKLKELVQSGKYCCAETMVRFGLWLRGEENEAFAGAAAALCGGMYAGFDCGALTGGALLLGMFAGSREEKKTLARELAEWFDETYGMEYGSVNCEDIAEGGRLAPQRCPALVEATGEKCVEILKAHGLLPREA
jgi:C_GCAxxG_C_C family probable redox protein